MQRERQRVGVVRGERVEGEHLDVEAWVTERPGEGARGGQEQVFFFEQVGRRGMTHDN